MADTSEQLEFGKRLKAARVQAGLSGPQLAHRVGVERSVIPQYETGRSFPSVPVIKKLARALGVTLDALLFEEYAARDGIQDKELLGYFAKADQLQTHERALIKMFLENMLVRQEFEALKLAARGKQRAA